MTQTKSLGESFNPAPRIRFVKERPEKSSKPKKEIPRKNKKRAARVFAEDFHSVEFVKWIQGFPCAGCSVEGLSVAAHIKPRGSGGKVEDNVIPLCEDRGFGTPFAVVGCHWLFDNKKPPVYEQKFRFKQLAKKLWATWCESQSSSGSKRGDS